MFSLQRAILETVTYADVLGRPLSVFEIWKELLRSDGDGVAFGRIPLSEVVEAIDSSFLRKRIATYRGFVFLCGRKSLVSLRLRREKLADRSLLRARRVARILSFLPFVRMVAITGSLAMKNSDEKSDWDFFIVLAGRHIWTGRAVVTAILHILGLRRHGKRVAQRACLNYWITTDSLEVDGQDVFASSEYSTLIPLFGRETFSAFEYENAAWILGFRPMFDPAEGNHRLLFLDTRWSRTLRQFFEWLFSHEWIEDWLRDVQQSKILSNPKTKWPGSRIEATDRSLVFLPRPASLRIFDTFRRRLGEIEAGVK